MESRENRVGPGESRVCPYSQRALSIWPRLDQRALSRCACDPQRIARLVSRRTSLPMDAILALVTGPTVSPLEVETWFG